MLTIAAGSIASTGTVTVTAVDNRVDAADKTVAVSGTAANSRAGGDGMDMTVTAATLTIADDDEKGLAFADGAGRAFAPPSPLAVAEGDPAGAPYTVTLTSRPVGTVTVAVASDNAEVEVSPGRLTFAPSDWNEAQTVTVTAHDDGDDYADAAVLTHTASGGGYDDGDAVVGTLAVAVDSERGTKLVVGGAGETTYRIGGRTVTVVVRPGVAEGIELDLDGPARCAVARASDAGLRAGGGAGGERCVHLRVGGGAHGGGRGGDGGSGAVRGAAAVPAGGGGGAGRGAGPCIAVAAP